jgi:hypothetical protein
METKGLVIIYGSLLIIIAMIACGIYFDGTIAKAVLTLGIVAGIAWILLIFNLAMAMGSDI